MKNFRKLFCVSFLMTLMVSCKGSSQTTTVAENVALHTGPNVEASMEQGIDQATGSNVSNAEAAEFLAHHNMARNEVGVSNLVWNTTIAEAAQKFADQLASENCSFGHSGNQDYGENIFMGNGIVFTALDASKNWYSEKEAYVYNNTNFDHYTQIVWKTTTDVGVGVSVCEDGSYIIVANYSPSGNMLGEYPY